MRLTSFSLSFIPYPISDSVWLAHGSLLVGAGHQMLLFGQSRTDPGSDPLFEHVALHNGPLQDYHPQMLLQCLLWGPSFPCVQQVNIMNGRTEKVELVKEIIVNLANAIEEAGNSNEIIWKSIAAEQFWRKDHTSKSVL